MRRTCTASIRPVDFGVCRPSPHEFQVLERAISFEDSAQICQIFESWSAAAQSVRINNWRTHFETEAASFSVARAALTRALEQPNDIVRRVEVPAALAAYRAAGKGSGDRRNSTPLSIARVIRLIKSI